MSNDNEYFCWKMTGGSPEPCGGQGKYCTGCGGLIMSHDEFDRMMATPRNKAAKLRRFDIKKIYSKPKIRRKLIAEGTVVVMRREGIEITLEQALASYDEVMREKV